MIFKTLSRCMHDRHLPSVINRFTSDKKYIACKSPRVPNYTINLKKTNDTCQKHSNIKWTDRSFKKIFSTP